LGLYQIEEAQPELSRATQIRNDKEVDLAVFDVRRYAVGRIAASCEQQNVIEGLYRCSGRGQSRHYLNGMVLEGSSMRETI
jgi:hypothetical protein